MGNLTCKMSPLSPNMAAIPYAYLFALATIIFFFLYPAVHYFKDPKRLRRFPNLSLLSGISSLPFIVVAHGGFRSKYLAKVHKKHPVIRTGPNALSYGDPRAIKDIYGHNTKCVKDEHQRKRKVLSSAYALKNLEEWEFKVADKAQR